MKVLLVDDERLIREGMAYLLGLKPDVDIVAQASHGEEALALCANYPIDLVLMDIRMPVMDGVQTTKLIKEKYPDIKVLILTTFKDDQYIQDAVASGASGYLLKDSSPELIYNSMVNILTGGFVMAEPMARGVVDRLKPTAESCTHTLTEREVEIVGLIAEGMSNKEIGERLFLTEGSIKNAITSILAKLGLKDRTQIAIFAFKNGFAS